MIAQALGVAASTAEFLDRYRLPGESASRIWEERFGEQAYLTLANDAIERLNAYQEGFSERLSSTTPPAETMFLRGADDACELIDSFFRLYLDDARMS